MSLLWAGPLLNCQWSGMNSFHGWIECATTVNQPGNLIYLIALGAYLVVAYLWLYHGKNIATLSSMQDTELVENLSSLLFHENNTVMY